MNLDGVVSNFGSIIEAGYTVITLNGDELLLQKKLYADLAHTELIYTKDYVWSADVLISWTLTVTTTGETFTTLAAQTEAWDLDALRYFVLRGTVNPPISLSVGANVVATFPVDVFGVGVYDVTLTKPTTGVRYKSTLTVMHDGTPTGDAAGANFIEEGILLNGTVDVTLSVALTGTGVSQAVQLIATAASSGWVLRMVRRLVDA